MTCMIKSGLWPARGARNKIVLWIGAIMLGVGLMNTAFGAVCPVDEAEAKQWLNHVIPLPKQIEIRNKQVLPPAGIAVQCRKDAGAVEQNAARELEDWFKARTGMTPTGSVFTILLGVLDAQGNLAGMPVADADKLKGLPNKDQAYIIQPAGENRLLLAALNEKGVYYAVQTLRQLLAPATSKDQVEIPLVSVLDWPDIAERGLWNSLSEEIVYELAALKLNYARLAARVNVASNKHTASIPKKELMIKGRLRAVNYVPNITHLNFLHRTGLFKVYPGLEGKGASAFAGQYQAHGGAAKAHPVPCASNPLLVKILADWMRAIAAEGALECGCWLTERPAQCGCAKCMAAGQFVQEARAFIAAWRETQKQYPFFTIRLFLSTTTDEKYDRIMAELPAGVKIERACAMGLERVHGEPRDRFVNALLDPYAAKGVWIASYDVPIGVNGKVETPEFKLPESCVARVRDYVRQLAERKYSGAYGMLAFGHSDTICDFNITALAEYGWNVKGRSERDFAIAWATRRGYAHPGQAADWSDLAGPLEFDVYDSEFPVGYSWGLAAKMIKERRPPKLGEGIFRYYESREAFDKKLTEAEKALAIAGKLEKPDLAYETKILISYIKLAKNIYLIAEQTAGGTVSNASANASLAGYVAALKQAGAENVAAIRQWRSALGPEPWHPRVTAAIRGTKQTVSNIVQSVVP